MLKSHYNWLNKEKGRYYKIILQKDMLNDWILTCIWGGINSRLGNYRHMMVNSLEDAATYIDDMIKKRKKRGYELISNIINSTRIDNGNQQEEFDKIHIKNIR